MNTYATEEEQVEMIKKWLKQYGPSIIIGIALALALSFGWRTWQHKKLQRADKASIAYGQMLTSFSQQQSVKGVQEGELIIKDYDSTPYAAMAALMLAKQAVATKNLAKAEKQLKWAVDNAHEKSVQQIASIRLARIYLNDKKPSQALKVLKQIKDKAFFAARDEVKGDIYIAQGKQGQARAAYQAAIKELPKNAAIKPMIEMKLTNVTSLSSNGALA